jgi:hypothetical protein
MYSIYWLVFIMLKDCGICEVETKVLYITDMNFSPQMVNNPQSIMRKKLVLQILEKTMCISHKNKYKSSKIMNNS